MAPSEDNDSAGPYGGGDRTGVADALGRARSFLFVPGDRPERFDRALAGGADAVVVDLEDAVPPDAKEAALANATALLGRATGVVIRVNDPRTHRGSADLAALGAAGAPVAVVVPKAEDAATVAAVLAALPPGSAVLPLIETAVGVLDARLIAAAPGVVRLVFGHLDLCAQLGLRPDDTARLVPARFALVAASAAAGLPAPVDGVCTEVRDRETVLAQARASLDSGFTGKLCIHPAQVPAVHEALAPDPDELAWALRVLELTTEDEVKLVDGHMVDRPVHLRARSIAARADR
ncbi:HpcH/HpaI aldolase/citrate lyase family protein [Streptomyces sp. NPDC088197]|uniref:HpcH/HpaI aldolase/citrate lyase family protein n=1 Tax=Streptomyces sp. NPDC088197 TaxID=3365840 RepID=UPI003806C337